MSDSEDIGAVVEALLLIHARQAVEIQARTVSVGSLAAAMAFVADAISAAQRAADAARTDEAAVCGGIFQIPLGGCP